MPFFSGVKSFWPVQNNQSDIDAIKKVNIRNKALLITNLRLFPALYKYFTQKNSKNAIKELINFCFKGEEKQFIAGTKFDATRTDDKDKFKITFDKVPLKLTITRSSRPEVFCKKGVLRNFTKFTGKHLCQSLFFNKVAGLRRFPVNFVKFLRTPFFIEHLW